MKYKSVLLLLIAAVFIVLASEAKAKAEPLAGLSYYTKQFYDNGGEFYTEEDLTLLSEVMYHENGSNSDLCLLYTGSVVLNRQASKEWPNTIHDVLYQRGQYATVPYFYTKKIPEHIRDLARQLLIFGSELPRAYVYQAMRPQTNDYIKVDTEYFCR